MITPASINLNTIQSAQQTAPTNTTELKSSDNEIIGQHARCRRCRASNVELHNCGECNTRRLCSSCLQSHVIRAHSSPAR